MYDKSSPLHNNQSKQKKKTPVDIIPLGAFKNNESELKTIINTLAQWWTDKWGKDSYGSEEVSMNIASKFFSTRANSTQLPVTLLAYSGKELVGMVSLIMVTPDSVYQSLNYKSDRNNLTNTPMLLDLLVHPDHQDKGIGTQLITKSLDYLTENQAQYSRAFLFIVESELQTYYEKLGWNYVGEGEFKPAEDIVLKVSFFDKVLAPQYALKEDGKSELRL